MGFNKKFFQTGGIVASSAAPAAFDPLQNFETVTYTGNGGTQKITGYIRKGAAFNGSSSVIDFSQPLLINTFSVSFFINTSNSSRQRILGNPYGGAGDYGWNIRTDTTTGHLQVEWSADGTNAIILDTGVSITDGNWHHIVAVWSNGSQKIYIDNVEQASSTNANDQYATTDTFKIGANWNNTEWFNGKLDQVRIFNKELSSSEVTTLYGETYASFTKSTTDIFGDGSGVALYELDEDANSSNFGQSADFNGSNSEVNISSNLGLTGNTTHSTSFWVNFDATTNQHIYAIGGGQSPSFQHSSIYFDTSLTRVLHDNNGNADIFSNTLSLSTGVWYHVVFTYNSSNRNGEVFIDGSSVGSTTLSKDLDLQSSATTCFGKRIAYNSNRLNGQLDEFKVFNKVLTSQEIDDLYYNTDVASGNLIAHYKLDGNATDETGNYDGTASNLTYSAGVYGGTPTNVDFLGMAFQPDLVWIKHRGDTGTYHQIYDSVRGAAKVIFSNDTLQEFDRTNGLTSFDSNGFSLGDHPHSNDGTAPNDLVAWCWKAGGTAVSNTDGSITSTVSANQDAGFSIVKYSGDNNASSRVPHGLSQAPEMIILKNLSTSYNWTVSHIGLNNDRVLFLEDTVAEQSTGKISGTIEAQENHTATTFGFVAGSGTYPLGGVNYTGFDCVAYCFHSVDGYQKVGSFQGTGNTSGNIVTTGFRPRFLMWKAASTTGNWQIVDSIRSPLADKRNQLYADLSQGEDVTSYDIVDFNDDSFQMKQQYTNKSGHTYIYLAIA